MVKTVLDALVVPAVLAFLGWAILTGALGFSGQLRILALIGVGIWFLLKRR